MPTLKETLMCSKVPGYLFNGVARELWWTESFPAKERFDWRGLIQTTPVDAQCLLCIESIEVMETQIAEQAYALFCSCVR